LENKIVILIGDVGSYLADIAKQLDPTASLVTKSNCVDLASGVYYTSLGDFDQLADFVQLLAQADTLIYQPPDQWSDCDSAGFSYMKVWTEFYLLFYQSRAEVLEIHSLVPPDINSMLALSNRRHSDQPQLWNVGCSITHGVGVEDHERYGQLVADFLNLPVSFLSASGSSIPWAADQILRSDIRENDIVVWGLTSHSRFPYYSDNVLVHVNASYYQQNPQFNSVVDLSKLDSANMQYSSVVAIAQVVNFCKKIGATLIIAGVLVDRHFIQYAARFPNYIQLLGNTGHDESTLFIDLGTDNNHPGPAAHKYYAKHIINKINTIKK
jgi:hypothetical protein